MIYKATNLINGKVLGTSGKRDIINKLKELIKMYAVPSDD